MENNSSKKYSFFLKGGPKGILLIHGITGTPSEMHYLGKALHRLGFTVLCNTLPHHCGTLGELKRVTWQEIADACIRDFKQLRSQCEEAFVGGLSMGALMSIHIAHAFPGEAAGIIALAPTLFYDGWALHKGKILMNLAWHIPFLRNAVNIREGWPYGLKDETLQQNIARFYKNARASQFDNKVLLFGSPFFPLVCLYQHHRFTKIVKQELPQVKTPILILHAQEDDMTSLRNARYVLDTIASQDKKLVVLDDCYHMITIDKQKDRVVEETFNFIKRL